MRYKLLPFLLILTLSCSSSNKNDAETFLTVGKNSFSFDSFRNYVSELTGNEMQFEGDAYLFDLLEQYINEQLILTKASDDNNTPLESMKYLDRKKAVEKYVRENITGVITVTEEEIMESCLKRPDNGSSIVNVEAWHIQLDNQNELEDVVKVLEKEEADFSELAEIYSASPDKGNLVHYKKGSLPKEIEEVIFSLKEGEISDPVYTSYGYHIFKVGKVFSQQPTNDDRAKTYARKEILEQKARIALKKYIKELKKEYKVKIKTEYLSKDLK